MVLQGTCSNYMCMVPDVGTTEYTWTNPAPSSQPEKVPCVSRFANLPSSCPGELFSDSVSHNFLCFTVHPLASPICAARPLQH